MTDWKILGIPFDFESDARVAGSAFIGAPWTKDERTFIGILKEAEGKARQHMPNGGCEQTAAEVLAEHEDWTYKAKDSRCESVVRGKGVH